jgi:hypothetical protein
MSNLTEKEKEAYAGLPDPTDLPFGITLEDMERFDREQEEWNRTYNGPVRDVEKETFWDVVNTPASEGESIFTPEVMEVFRRELR